MNNKILHWFGDSWCAGHPGGGIPFPNLTSEKLDYNFINHGVKGTSVEEMLKKFNNVYPSLTSNDIVIFCLTSPARVSLSDTLNFRTLDKESKKIWDTYFVTDETLSHLLFNYLNTLYFMCKTSNITCYFVNSFTKLIKQDNLLVPGDAWILPLDQCLASVLVTLFDLKHAGPALNDELRFLDVEWLEHKELLKKYFLPNDPHPNQLGNEKLAEFLTEKLKLKLNDSR
jgi:hypothetical protein